MSVTHDNQHYLIAEAGLPATWVVVSFGQVVQDHRTGFSKGEVRTEPVGVPQLRPMNIDRACRRYEKPVLIVENGVTRPSDVRAWIEQLQVEVLNVAGNRELKNPGLGQEVETFLGTALGIH
jgi:hypothetical protein